MTTQTDLCQELESSFAELLQAAATLTAAEQADVILGDGWTVGAVLAHVAYWDDFQTRRMQAAVAGTSAATGFPRDGVSNDARRDADRSRATGDAQRAAEAARARLVAFVAALTDEQLEAKYPEGSGVLYLGGLVRHMVQHAREHAAQIAGYDRQTTS